MKTKSVCAVATLVALAIASAPAMARGGRGGGGGKSKGSYSSTARSTAKVVKTVAKAVKPKTTQQKASSTPVGNSFQSNAAPSTQPTTNQGRARPSDCMPPKPNFDPVRGICVEI